MDTNLKTLAVREFCKERGFTQAAPKVRVNQNGYPFVTFINPSKPKDEQAENVYFSKAASQLVAEGDVVTKDMLNNYQVGFTTNGEGEERIKLISNSERVELDW